MESPNVDHPRRRAEDALPDYDVIVLGGGSAGTSAASAATQAGARTLLINDGELGGLCILRGCMPTKTMLASTHLLHEARRAEALGLRFKGRLVPDFARIMERKQSLVRRFQRAKIASVEAQDYEVAFGRAEFVAGGGISLDGRRLEARGYVVATGSMPTFLPIPGLDRVPVLSSDDVMRLTTPPKRMLVQGAGPVGLELSQFFARIGTEVLLVNRSPLLSHHDADCGAELTHVFEAEPGLELAVPGQVESLSPSGSGMVARLRIGERERDLHADVLLMATGRRPALDGLGLEHVGLGYEGGRLEHDETMRTANPSIWVAGDATGRFQILHMANLEGAVAGANAAGVAPLRRMDYRLKMSMIFTDPPFASVGDGEDEARRQGRDVIVSTARFPETGRAITMSVEHGLWKVLADRRDGEILGSAILGPRADDLAHLVSTLMHYRAKAGEICRLPWYHPTLSEVLLTLGRDLACQQDAAPPPGETTLPPGDLTSPRR
jgi:pyruvate/2-oxoglutarate dehydrogenase complex dihydrolipoamide dehydrogenase (E3) component